MKPLITLVKSGLILTAILGCQAFAVEADSKLVSPYTPVAPTTTINPASGSDAPKNWTHGDLRNYADKMGGGKASAGQGSQLMNTFGASDPKLISGGRKSVETTTLSADPKYKDTASMTSYQKYEQTINAAAVSNSTLALSKESGKIRCYITRDIGFAYTCTKTGLTYGGQVNDDGTNAKNQCVSGCYEGFDCVAVNNGLLTASEKELLTGTTTLSINAATKVRTIDLAAMPSRKTALIKIDAELDPALRTAASEFFVDISFKKANDPTFYPLIKRLFVGRTATGPVNLTISENLETLKMSFYQKDGEYIPMLLKSVKLIFNEENKWICKGSQDITELTPSNFSYNCPGGTVSELTLVNGNTVKICQNGALAGDNKDGTYSDKKSCESICRQSYSCIPSYSAFGEDKLKSFREGCISGSCQDDLSGNGDAASGGDCKIARMSNMPIIEEEVFDAHMNKIKTVTSGVVVLGNERPRIMDSDDVDYQNRNKEEWKDLAYKNMQAEGTYNTTALTIDENTPSSSAYGIGMSAGVDAGTLDATQRSLFWKLKPSAHDVRTSTNLFYYAILQVDLDYYWYDLSGKMTPKRDRIYYIKTSAADTFKPIRRSVEYAIVNVDANMRPVEVVNAYASPRNETFIGTSWSAISLTQTAEAFKAGQITTLSPYEMNEVVSNMSRLAWNLPGVIRSKTMSGPTTTVNYSGEFGYLRQAIAKYSVYTKYSKTSLTYKNLLDDIDAETLLPIYNSALVPHYTKDVISDSDQTMSKEVEIYKYGRSNSLSSYMRIKPKPSDIGRKGFVFVFVY